MKLQTVKSPAILADQTLTVVEIIMSDNILREVHLSNGLRIVEGRHGGISLLEPAPPTLVTRYAITPSPEAGSLSLSIPPFKSYDEARLYLNNLPSALQDLFFISSVEIPEGES